MTIGLLPAIPILWKAEQLIDYCGHNNIFIGAFTFYIIRYTGMALMNKPEWILLCEVFEVFTLSLVWVTAVLYFRHLVPRKYTATGQALPVMAHFCIGNIQLRICSIDRSQFTFFPTLQGGCSELSSDRWWTTANRSKNFVTLTRPWRYRRASSAWLICCCIISCSRRSMELRVQSPRML